MATDFQIGATFAPSIAYTPDASSAYPTLAGVAITSQIKTARGVVIATLTATIATGNLAFTLTTGSTAGWPLGKALWDIKFTKDGVSFYSDTVELNLKPTVTV